MQLIAPDILAEASGMSYALISFTLLFGFLLWLCGWRWHRFWVVMGITLGGGLVGIYTGRTAGGHILATAILLAVSAGILALELARVLAFVAAGFTVWLSAEAAFPQARELWVAFLIGGLGGVLLYRIWTMLLTGFLGTLIMGHATIVLSERLLSFDAVTWADSRRVMLNGMVLAMAGFALVGQSWVERKAEVRKSKQKKKKEQKTREKIKAEVKAELPPPPPSVMKSKSWKQKLFGGKKAA